jgi:hypothetical protein
VADLRFDARLLPGVVKEVITVITVSVLLEAFAAK